MNGSDTITPSCPEADIIYGQIAMFAAAALLCRQGECGYVHTMRACFVRMC